MSNAKLLTVLVLASLTASGQDATGPGSECIRNTLTFFTIPEGFYLTDYCKYAEFGAYEFTVDRGARNMRKEGIYREAWYRKKEDSKRVLSGLQILQNHVQAIKAVGGEVVKESDGSVFRTTYHGNELWIYVNANTSSTDLDNYGIISVEVQVMKQEVTAQDIQGTIAAQGKIALYGILFDTGKSDIKPESEKAINAIATYLQQNPEVTIYIVGHTDNVGDLAMNQKLSRSRGESVKNFLVTRHGIAAVRLTGDGVGPVCPVSTNETEEGRTLNRRVEVVRK